MTSIDLTQVLLWQYNDAQKLQALIQKQQDWLEINHNQFWSDWCRDVFDLRTANDFGLSVWAMILGVSFSVEQSDGTKEVFGFAPYGANFFGSTFSAVANSDVTLSADQKRIILQLRYFQMSTRATIPAINFVLKSIFGGLSLIEGDMEIFIAAPGTPSSSIQSMLFDYGVLPIPSTVRLSTRYNINAFGFVPYGKNFYNSTFGG
jgi:hypothetical protein